MFVYHFILLQQTNNHVYVKPKYSARKGPGCKSLNWGTSDAKLHNEATSSICLNTWVYISALSSFFIRPKSDHCLPSSVTDSLNFYCWDLTDVTLSFEGAKSKLLDVVSVADNDAQVRVDDNLVDILMLKFGEDFEARISLGFWSWSLLKILRLRFGQDFEADVW